MKVPAETVEAGDICVVCGIDDILIGETLEDKVNGSTFPGIKIEDSHWDGYARYILICFVFFITTLHIQCWKLQKLQVAFQAFS